MLYELYNRYYIITLDESYKFEYGRLQGIFSYSKETSFFLLIIIFISNY